MPHFNFTSFVTDNEYLEELQANIVTLNAHILYLDHVLEWHLCYDANIPYFKFLQKLFDKVVQVSKFFCEAYAEKKNEFAALVDNTGVHAYVFVHEVEKITALFKTVASVSDHFMFEDEQMKPEFREQLHQTAHLSKVKDLFLAFKNTKCTVVKFKVPKSKITLTETLQQTNTAHKKRKIE